MFGLGPELIWIDTRTGPDDDVDWKRSQPRERGYIDGEVVAALSASGPTFRLTPERVPRVAEAVCRAADEISRRLGAPSHRH